MAAERLQKIIAAAGIASRRKAEELITGGRVTVNGQVVTELGSKADPESDHIKVDGKLLHGPERHIYLALNKPRGYVTTVTDPEGRPTVMDLVKHVGERVYPIGRLDFNSEGLLILTNDGELANFLTRAGSHVPKTYLVKVAGQPQEEDVEKLRHGVRIGNKPGESGPRSVRTAPAEVRLLREADNPWYEVTLIEGKNRQIRRMFEVIGHHVEKIKRVSYGSLKLDLEPGEFRELTPQEVAALRRPAKQREGEAERPAAKVHARHIGKAALKKAPFRRDNRRFRDDRERRPEEREGARPRDERRPFRPAGEAGEERRPFRREERTRKPEEREGVRPRDERRPFRPAAEAGEERRPFRREEGSRQGFARREQHGRSETYEGRGRREKFGNRERRGRSERREDHAAERGRPGFREEGGAEKRRQFRGGRPFGTRSERRGPDRQEPEGEKREFREFRGRDRRESGPEKPRGGRPAQGERREFSRNPRRGPGGQGRGRGPESRSGKPRSPRGQNSQRRGRPGGRFRP